MPAYTNPSSIGNTSTYSYAIFIADYDQNGNAQWATTLGGGATTQNCPSFGNINVPETEGDWTFGISTDNSGNIDVAGMYFPPDNADGNLYFGNPDILNTPFVNNPEGTCSATTFVAQAPPVFFTGLDAEYCSNASASNFNRKLCRQR